ncbi:MAG TPA: hypothetical protein VJB14_17120 [Planctomycetota bacterium]|nr:hypothetical protein [Planctomycetota bacterium]
MARILTLWIAAAGGALAFAQETPTAPPKDFVTLHAQLCKREKWETVPWRTDLHDARAASVKEGKPIFIWAMDGQTLGCT